MDGSRKGRIHAFWLLIGGAVLFSPLILHAKEAPESTCIRCHLDAGGDLAKPALQIKESVHREKEISCHDCHGGDPTAEDMEVAMSKEKGFVGVPRFDEIPEFCARCHADPERMKHFNIRTDQFEEYKTSQHGKLLYGKKDPNVATCVSCHGVHDIKAKSDPRSPVFKTNIPRTCARCHSNAKHMASYGIPTNQYELYEKSVHGKLLLVKKDRKAPECADCHGIHGASPPGFTDIANICSYCHGKIAEHFKQSPHYVGTKVGEGARCIQCHGNHDIQHPTTAMYAGSGKGHCGQCHSEGSAPLKLAAAIKERIDQAISRVDAAARGIDSVRDSGRNLDSLHEQFEKARSALVQSRALTHTLSVEKIDKQVSQLESATGRISDEVGAIQRELKSRKRSVVIVLLILGSLIAVLLLKLRSLGSSH